MTSVEIKYNPFKTKTEIAINGEGIAKTSNLYRYRNTPLEDWVDVLVPELVEYCNDDEISVSVFSIRKYIDDINDQIKSYSKKHRHVDIEVEEFASTGYKGRLTKINQIQETLASSVSVGESKPDIQVLVVSMADVEDYSHMIKDLVATELNPEEGYIISNFEYDEDGFSKVGISISELDDSFINIEVLIFPCLEECPNKYWRLLKEKTTQSENYMLLAQLNSKPKKNDELYGYISEQLERKGKQNKSRFIFISDSVDDNDEYLRDEYGVRNITILEDDDIDSAFRLVKKYVQNVCYIKKIVDKGNVIRKGLQSVQGAIVHEAEKNKSVEEIKKKKEEYRNQADLLIQHYHSLNLTGYPPVDAALLTKNFIDDLTIQLRELIKKGLKNDVKKCFEDRLREHVNDYLSGSFALRAENTVLNNGILLETHYPIMSLIEEIIDVNQLCNNFIEDLGGIRKKTESRQSLFKSSSYLVSAEIRKKTESSLLVDFYVWIIENLEQSDLSFDVDAKIKRKLNTVEDKIKQFFRGITISSYMVPLSKVIEEKIRFNEELIEENVIKVMQQIEEYEQKIDIDNSSKAEIANIEDIIAELDRTLEL